MAKRKKSRRRGATAHANAKLGAHIESLGLKTIEAYRVWCRQHGFSAALNKTWQARRQERAAHRRDQQAAQAEEALRQHIAQLGLDEVAAYQGWCRQQGLSDAIHKSTAQRRKELKLHQQFQATQALHKARKHSQRTKDIILQIWDGAIAEEELRTEVLCLIYRAFTGLAADQRAQLRDLLLHVEKRAANLLDARPAFQRLGRVEGNTFVEALGALARHSGAWQQSPSEWKPDGRKSRWQFASLARFLLARYDVPACLDSVWFGGWGPEARHQQGWFVHVGNGQNIRTADLPLAFSKRMAHVFAKAPSNLRATEALRWAQVVGQGGSTALARSVIDTKLGRSFADESFWSTVVLFLAENPMLNPDMVGPIVDYINHQKFVVGEDRPPRPNYTMKGRTVVNLLRQVEEWHEHLARANRPPAENWESSGIAGFEWQWMDDKEEGLRWTIRELTSKKQLEFEGQAMNHCVASYASSCRQGSKSVWSMRVANAEGRSTRVATIAMHNPSRTIVEVRGQFNALPGGVEIAIGNSTLQQMAHTDAVLWKWVEAELQGWVNLEEYLALLAHTDAVLRKWIETEKLERDLGSY